MNKICIYRYYDLMDEKYFNSYEEMVDYNNLNLKKNVIFSRITYVGNYQNREDCLSIISSKNLSAKILGNDKKAIICSAINENCYAIYRNNRWYFEQGSLRGIYEEVKKRGISLNNDIYEKIDTRYRQKRKLNLH